jgi:hypothetical protein
MTSRSQLYPYARQLFASGMLNWAGSNIKIALLPVTFTPNFTAKFLSDLQAATTIMATSGNITNLADTNGYCDGDSTSLGIISSPLVAGALVFYKDTGTPSTSPLIVYFDTPDLPGLPQVLTLDEYFVYKNFSYGGWFRL